MRVSTKITASSGLFVLLIAGVLAYNLSLVRSLARFHSDFSSVSFRAALLALELIGLTEELKVNAEKFHVTSDSAYGGLWDTHREELANKLAELSALDHPPPEDRQVALLARSWAAFRDSRSFLLETPAPPIAEEATNEVPDPSSARAAALLQERLQHLSNLERGGACRPPELPTGDHPRRAARSGQARRS